MCIILPTDNENNQEQKNLEPSIAAISAILGSRGECWKTSIITCFTFRFYPPTLKSKKTANYSSQATYSNNFFLIS